MAKKSYRYKADDETRARVSSLISFGISREEIAKHLEIDPQTLMRHYPKELEQGLANANEKVANALFSKAVNDKDTASMIFWLKCRARWKPVSEKEDKTPQQTLLEIMQLLKENKNDQ